MKRLLLRLYPRRFRERYGDEIDDLLGGATLRDAADLVRGAASERIAGLRRPHARPVKALVLAAALTAAGGLVWLGYVIAGLAGGIAALPRHWWSVLPLLVLAVAGAVGFSAAGAIRRPGR